MVAGPCESLQFARLAANAAGVMVRFFMSDMRTSFGISNFKSWLLPSIILQSESVS